MRRDDGRWATDGRTDGRTEGRVMKYTLGRVEVARAADAEETRGRLSRPDLFGYGGDDGCEETRGILN